MIIFEEDSYEKIRRNLVVALTLIFIWAFTGIHVVEYLASLLPSSSSPIEIPPWKIKLIATGILLYLLARYFYAPESIAKRSEISARYREIQKELLNAAVMKRRYFDGPHEDYSLLDGNGISFSPSNPKFDFHQEVELSEDMGGITNTNWSYRAQYEVMSPNGCPEGGYITAQWSAWKSLQILLNTLLRYSIFSPVGVNYRFPCWAPLLVITFLWHKELLSSFPMSYLTTYLKFFST
ncbi:hypothetical protein A8O14_02710 [Polynucleobacter wuianus]|uniref:Uncharacterized protein n=1 Tax=Polynucleobacter wuianus TaxID=1743168 RepID=A0A191UDG7_9BURK|nr:MULTISPECIES: hypothetical protein [Polynucleobacter]ANI99098.1 hypothetical protein A8O14_02710 [Polynucleobacter wuianus]MBU3552329.1 hypothetical protein [Polynucleobacter sp. MWH-Post4-6-1]